MARSHRIQWCHDRTPVGLEQVPCATATPSCQSSLLSVLKQLGVPRILVLGDILLDRYTWGNAERVSPEAPVLVLRADTEEVRPGGAASVASLLRGLDAEVSLAGLVGNDASGRVVRKLLSEAGIDQTLVLDDLDRPTSTKERFIGRAANRHPHQILRVDREVCDPLSRELEARLSHAVVSQLAEYQALLISDYAKGVCTPRFLAAVIDAAFERGVPTIVDPARMTDYARYRGATLLTPNRVEAELATGRKISTPDEALAAGQDLCERLHLQAVIVTLDREGMVLARAETAGDVFPTKPRSVYDITGAGDMVLAMVGLGQAAGIPLSESVQLANVAAGLEVEKLGAATVSRTEIQAALGGTSQTPAGKLVTLDQMVELAESYRQAGQTIVFTNGCFDLFHAGHARCLQEASELGDILVVAVNSDNSVRRLKGPDRPVVSEQDRAALLAALGCVDHVLIFEEQTPHALLRRIRPNVLVKGGMYTPDKVVGLEVVESYGGKVCVTGKVEGVSTTQILSLLE